MSWPFCLVIQDIKYPIGIDRAMERAFISLLPAARVLPVDSQLMSVYAQPMTLKQTRPSNKMHGKLWPRQSARSLDPRTASGPNAGIQWIRKFEGVRSWHWHSISN